MCESYILVAKAKDIAKKFDVEKYVQQEFDFRIRGYPKTETAPVVVHKNGKTQIRELIFSICPEWASKFPFKPTTYNARMRRYKRNRMGELVLDKNGNKIIEYIYEVPTWRNSFNKGHTCLVPLTSAIESCYFGTHGGQMVQFCLENKETYYVAGLWEDWMNRTTGEVKETFTLITDDPYEAFFNAGHDRSIFIIRESAYEDWLKNKKMSGVERYKFLLENRVELPWKVETDRFLKSKWQKDTPTEEELAEIKVWRPNS
tara:strand:- start:23002 stop:23778 length:777 start_codon:yes stop_codon:yes gene_type:complete